MYLNEVINLEEYKKYRAEYEEQLAALPDMEQPIKNLKPLKQVLDCNFEIIYNNLNNEEKRAFWRSIIKEIRVSKSIGRNRKYQIIFL